MSARRDTRWILGLIGLMTLWRLAASALLPVTKDEAYYLDWARTLAWGYFDHPPGVAVLGLGIELAPGNVLAGRLGAVLVSALTLWLMDRLARTAGVTGLRERVLVLVVAFATLPGMAAGVIGTPDTVMALFWTLALHEALAALQHDRRRWLTAGLATGLGLLGKYTMVLIGPVFLIAMLRADPKALRSPWPYVGGLLVVLVLLPHLWWNASNDWVSVRFQFGHGFATDTGEIALAETDLPAPPGGRGQHHHEMPGMTPGERLGSLAGFLGAQLALWGLLLLPLVAVVLIPARRRAALERWREVLSPAARTLLWTAIWFPIGFVALMSLGSEVEPNWPGMYLVAAAVVAALALAGAVRWLAAAAAVNLVLVSLYICHAATQALPLPDSMERVLRETYGFDQLAELTAGLSGPVFADRYQTAAMLRFRDPASRVTQWPGIKRPSEYSRGRIASIPALADVQAAGGFWLIGKTRPEIPGFELESSRIALACKGYDLAVTDADQASAHGAPCAKPLQRWVITRYRWLSSGD